MGVARGHVSSGGHQILKGLVKKTDQRVMLYQGKRFKIHGSIPGKDAYEIYDEEGEVFEISGEEFRVLLQQGAVTETAPYQPPRSISTADSLEYNFRLRVVEKALDLGAQGIPWKQRASLLKSIFCQKSVFTNLARKFPSQRTIEDWTRKYKEGGPKALVPRRSNSGNRKSRYDPVICEIVLDLIEQKYSISDRVTLSDLASEAADQYEYVCAEHGFVPGNYGRKVVERIVNSIPHSDILKWKLGGKEASRHMRVAKKFQAIERPYERIELDVTEADIILADDYGNPIGRPYICAAIDCATSWIVALIVTLHKPTSEDVAKAIREMMVYPEDSFFDEHNIVNRLKIAAIPKDIIMDQGSENDGPAINSLIDLAGFLADAVQPAKPEGKPFVENLFNDVRIYVSKLPGATKTQLLPDRKRTAKAMAEARLTYKEFCSGLQKWRFDDFGRRPRRKVQDVFLRGETPSAAWERLAREHIVPDPPTKEELDRILMVRTDTRVLRHYGIEFSGMQYHSDELAQLYRRIGPKRKVTIRYSPLDIRAIQVVDPHTGLPIAANNKVEGLAAISFRELKELRPPTPKHKGPVRTAAEIHADVQERRSLKNAPKSKMLRDRAAVIDRMRAADILARSQSAPDLPGQVAPNRTKMNATVARSKNLPKVEKKNAGPFS